MLAAGCIRVDVSQTCSLVEGVVGNGRLGAISLPGTLDNRNRFVLRTGSQHDIRSAQMFSLSHRGVVDCTLELVRLHAPQGPRESSSPSKAKYSPQGSKR